MISSTVAEALYYGYGNYKIYINSALYNALQGNNIPQSFDQYETEITTLNNQFEAT
jgi:hypothetical protein